MNDEQRLRDEIGIPDHLYEATFDEAGRLTGLQVHDEDYYSLEYDGDLLGFVSSFLYLKELIIDVDNSELTFNNLSAICTLFHLELLSITNCCLKDILPLASLLSIESLYLSNALIENIEPLRELKKLKHLNLSNNRITDISPLKGHSNLVSVDLSHNLITDITALECAANLQSLYIADNHITSLAPIAALTQLTSLHASRNSVQEIGPIRLLEKLVSLTLSQNPVVDISPLEPLVHLELLEIDGIPADNLCPIGNAIKLKKLIASDIKFTDGSIIGGFVNLKGLSLRRCNISNISFVINLTGLYYIELDHNEIQDATILLSLPDLHRISLQDNRITQPFLTYPYKYYSLDLSGNPFGNKNYRNFNEYLIDAATYYFKQGDLDKALAYHFIEVAGKIPLLIYYQKLCEADPADSYYQLYYTMRCEQLLKKLTEEDDETKAIRIHLIELIKASDFFNRTGLLISLDENGEAVDNYHEFSEYIHFLKNEPNPKPNTELAYFLAKTFMRQEDLPQLLSIYKQLLDKEHPFHFTIYRMIKSVLGYKSSFKAYDYYLDLLINARDREILYFDIFKYLNALFGKFVHDQSPPMPKATDWQVQRPDNNTGWKVAFWLSVILLILLALSKGCG